MAAFVLVLALCLSLCGCAIDQTDMNSLMLALNEITEIAQSAVPTAHRGGKTEGSGEKQAQRTLEDDELAARARANINGKEEFYISDDFDGDGLSEAFYCVGFTGEGKYWRYLYLYFIDSYGNISEVDWHFEHEALIYLDYSCATAEIMEFGTAHFLVVNYYSRSTTGGTDLIGVRNGQAYAPEGMQALLYIKKDDASRGDTFDLQIWKEECVENYLFDEASRGFILQS